MTVQLVYPASRYASLLCSARRPSKLFQERTVERAAYPVEGSRCARRETVAAATLKRSGLCGENIIRLGPETVHTSDQAEYPLCVAMRAGRLGRARAWAAPLVSMLLLSMTGAACSPHQVKQDAKPAVKLGEAFSETSVGGGDGPVRPNWWRDFGDAVLTEAVEAALGRNHSLRAGFFRLRQAEAAVRIGFAGRLPSVDVSTEVSRQKITAIFGSFENSFYSGSVAASYELDLFGRLKSAHASAKSEFEAARFDYAAMRISLAAEVAEAYLALREATRQVDVLRRRAAINEDYLALTRLRYESGLIAAIDMGQQEQEKAATSAALAESEASRAQAFHALRILTADALPPGVDDEEAAIPELPPLPDLGVPSDLLLQRPDIRAMHARLVAADHRIAQALADRFPRLMLSGSIGIAGVNISQLFTDFVWSAVASTTAALFDGGRGRAQVDMNRSAYQELLEDYAQVAIEALVETEQALALEAARSAQLQALKRQLDAASQVLEQSKLRYQQGLTDYLPVLTALTIERNAEQATLAAKRQLLSSRIQLFRALGGGFHDPETAEDA